MAVIAGALGVVLAHNPVHSALFLLMTLVSVAVLFLQLDAALVAAIQVVVYASAIVVLFVFVITLLGVDKHESFDEPSLFQRPVAIVLGVLLFVQIVVLAGHHWATGAHSTRGTLDGAAHRQRRDARDEPVHRLRLGVRDHRGAARDRGRRRRRARAPERPAAADARPRRRGERVVIAVASVTPTYYLTLAAALFTIGAVGLLVRRNTLVMFMCIELMLNAANLTFVVVRQGAQRHQRPGDRVLHARGRGRRGRGRARDHRGDLPAPPRRDRRRPERARGLTVTARDLLDLAWIIPALPAFGAVVLLLFGKRIGEPHRGLDRHRADGARVRRRR